MPTVECGIHLAIDLGRLGSPGSLRKGSIFGRRILRTRQVLVRFHVELRVEEEGRRFVIWRKKNRGLDDAMEFSSTRTTILGACR